jgi:UDP-N-acetylmuramate dehydrogenase
MSTSFQQELEIQLKTQIQTDELLSKYTTLGVGGPAEFFLTAHSADQIKTAVKLAQKFNLKTHILGGGSNVVISDTGLKGLTIRSQLTDFEVINPPEISTIKSQVSPRLITLTDKANYKADELKPSFNQNTPTEYIKVGSGWKMNALVQKCLQENLTGLEWFSGIPGSVGGGIYMNMHGGNFFWSDFVEEVETITQDGETKTYSNQELEFDYDYSLLHKTKDIILSATLKVYAGDVTQAKKIFSYWAAQKTIHQPQRSAGCMYQNLTTKQAQQAGLKSSSIGYIIDQELGLKGYQVGGAKISEKHAAFIENTGSATAQDVEQLVKLVEQKIKRKYNIDVKREVEFIKD